MDITLGSSQSIKSRLQESDWTLGQIQEKATFCLPSPSKCCRGISYRALLSSACKSLTPSACSQWALEVDGKWPRGALSQGPRGGADSGIGQQSRSQAVWNQTEKLMDCFEHGLSELLHIQGGKKRTKTKINQVYALRCSGRLGFYQLQNPASSTVQHLFISYKVALNKLSVWLASQLNLPSPVSQIHKVFIDDCSCLLQRIQTNILITGYFSSVSVLLGTSTQTKHGATVILVQATVQIREVFTPEDALRASLEFSGCRNIQKGANISHLIQGNWAAKDPDTLCSLWEVRKGKRVNPDLGALKNPVKASLPAFMENTSALTAWPIWVVVADQ